MVITIAYSSFKGRSKGTSSPYNKTTDESKAVNMVEIEKKQHEIDERLGEALLRTSKNMEAISKLKQALGIVEPPVIDSKFEFSEDTKFRNPNFRNGGLFELSKTPAIVRVHSMRHGSTEDFDHDINYLKAKMKENRNCFESDQALKDCAELLDKQLEELKKLKDRKDGKKTYASDKDKRRVLKNQITGAGVYILRSFDKKINTENKKINKDSLIGAMCQWNQDMKNYDKFLESVARAGWIAASITGGSMLGTVASPFAGAGLTGAALGLTPSAAKTAMWPITKVW